VGQRSQRPSHSNPFARLTNTETKKTTRGVELIGVGTEHSVSPLRNSVRQVGQVTADQPFATTLRREQATELCD
jgi:hypothetical protein